MTAPPHDPSSDPGAPPVASIRLRHVKWQVITGRNGAELVEKLNAFSENAGEGVYVATHHIADWEVLVIYAE